MFIYRRVAVLAGARADVQPLARAWGVVIFGHIGRNSLRVMEPYVDLRMARQRRREINRQGVALIDSVENVLYPLQTYYARFDTQVNKVPPMPLNEPELRPYTRVGDLYPHLRRQ